LQPDRFDEFGDIIQEFALRISRRFGYEPELNGHVRASDIFADQTQTASQQKLCGSSPPSPVGRHCRY
jgi:hypothetical protein